jgi:HD-GYP domain-containing protein (c-di-GMP phosphodiesterase class II)
MTSDRPYSLAQAPQDALAELRRCAGSQFDPQIVAAFEAVLAPRESEDAPTEPQPTAA